MAIRSYLRALVPFASDKPEEKRAIVDVDSFTRANASKGFKVRALAVDQAYGFSRGKFETAPYDFDRIIQACETDSYVNQAFNKYKELLWKEGWDISGESTDAVNYLYERLGYMEFTMRRPFQDLLRDIGDQLVKFNNAFVAKARSDVLPDGFATPIGSKPNPIVGYYVIPAETIEIRRDRYNRPLSYRQRLDTIAGAWDINNQPTWEADEVIHFTLDRKPGRAFGTPFIEPVLDDVIALRQLEEDIQNLVHKELFPLYKYKVGTPEYPAEEGEVDKAADELANLRTDGGLILPDRHDVEVIGAQNNALDASGYLEYFLNRVTAGLGISPHHLGLVSNSGNRAVTDRLDIALYDKVKLFQRYLSDMFRLHIFTELLIEGGYDPLIHPHVEGESDRCEFKFREIDIDSLIKKENHEIQKFAQNVSTQPETRIELGMRPEVDEDELQAAIMFRLTPTPEPAAGGTPPKKPNAATSSTGGRSNPKNTTKGPGNRSQPSNQYGTRTSPNVRHSVDEAWLNDVVELLEE